METEQPIRDKEASRDHKSRWAGGGGGGNLFSQKDNTLAARWTWDA